MFPPGEYIRDELDARGWTQEKLAQIMGRPETAISQIINGSKAITTQTAKELGAAFGTSAELWMNLEGAYRLALEEADASDVARRAEIYARAPVPDMLRRGWIKHCDTVEALAREVLRFEQVPCLEDWPPQLAAAARRSGEAQEESFIGQVAWLCRLRQLAPQVPAERFSASRVDKHLEELHALTQSERELRRVPAVLAKMGIRFLVVEHLPRTHIDGYTLWLDEKTPVIALSLRSGRIDWFWFTLAHELSHVRHGDRPLIDNDLVGRSRSVPTSDIEIRANEEASNWLIPSATLSSFIARTKPRYYKQRIIQFAGLHQIHPGIVVGQLQHRGEIDYRHDREMLVDVRNIVTRITVTDGWGRVPDCA
ncbi:MAG: helix-turn-helix domain-containing protein [Thermoguttaceae bacterium]|jgi:HTH-type transcriptional regulator/antitoxin HigA